MAGFCLLVCLHSYLGAGEKPEKNDASHFLQSDFEVIGMEGTMWWEEKP